MSKKNGSKTLTQFFDTVTGTDAIAAAPVIPSSVNVPRQVQECINYSEFKQLVDSIHELQTRQKITSIAVLSELSLEGKSLFCGSLAIALARFLKQRILVVDTAVFPNTGSLSIEEILEPDHSRVDAMGSMPTLFPGVTFLKLSPEHARAGVEYDIQKVIQDNMSKVDLILFDTCALSQKNRNNIDPLVVARRVDGSLLLVSPRARALGALEGLDKAVARGNLKVLGVIDNQGFRG